MVPTTERSGPERSPGARERGRLAPTSLLWVLIAGLGVGGLSMDARARAAAPPPAISPRSVFLDALREFEGVPEESFEERLSSFVEAWITRTAVTGDPAEQRRRRKALLLGLGACFDAGGDLEAAPGIGSRFRGVVRAQERAARADLCARARLHGRRDAAQHFFVAAALTATIGPGGAAHAGLLKEIADARGRDRRPPEGTGFSFVDLAHDHAGIRFACHLLGLDRFDPEAPRPPLPRFLPPSPTSASRRESVGRTSGRGTVASRSRRSSTGFMRPSTPPCRPRPPPLPSGGTPGRGRLRLRRVVQGRAGAPPRIAPRPKAGAGRAGSRGAPRESPRSSAAKHHERAHKGTEAP